MSCRHVFDDGKGCKRSALYNLADLYPAYCKDHKTDDMVNVYSVRCDYVSEFGVPCKKTVSWGYPDTKKKVRCAEHKLDGMDDLKHPRCMEPKCPNQRSYGFAKDKVITHCSVHSKTGMVNLKHKMCEECGENIPSFNYEGEKTARFCGEHKLDGMVDVAHTKCVTCNTNRALYNFKGQAPRYCVDHRETGMLDVFNKLCEYGECPYKPKYNVSNETKPRFCVEHKTDDMVVVVGKKCKNEWCDERFTNNKYEDYCIRCFVHLFPEKQVARNYKTKEKAVCDFVIEKFSNVTWVSDKRIQDGCSRRRPDLLLDLGYQVIIVEVDENQHMDYDCSCENKRLMELSKDVGHRNIVFIRFNPDDYTDRYNKKIKSCWSINKTNGLSVVNTKDGPQWKKRLQCLQQQVQYWIDNKTDKTIETVQLFYDEC
jgi:hypothetical protein